MASLPLRHEREGVTLSPRAAYEAALRRKSIRLAVVSSLAFAAAVVIFVPMAPGWEAVRTAFFNWDLLVETFPKLLQAFLIDLMLFAWCAPAILVLALVIALMRNISSPTLFPLKVFAIFYTDLFRSVPIILTVYIVGFGIPGLGLQAPWNSPYLWGSVALTLTYSAYLAEVYRSGIESIHKSQTSAALSLGFSQGDVMRFIILPQMVSRIMPAIMNFMVSLQKDVALLSFIGPIEVLRQANVFKALYANFTPYVGAAILFLCITIPATRFSDYLIARERARRTG
ncbi:amino acid ABC transporter permease [Rhizobium sp. KVB221]|uniref:Amino acid ABC transporter permease n=1 Tax=Rhizobium setariae TaxID=2801340 RepID=A0A936YRE7_9HYPH|nr:amino acid ABC transporter permease [Rhizobium setariae]MBL0375464.1 amino acid ABC transporter permease [Rhizobium setariae]